MEKELFRNPGLVISGYLGCGLKGVEMKCKLTKKQIEMLAEGKPLSQGNLTMKPGPYVQKAMKNFLANGWWSNYDVFVDTADLGVDIWLKEKKKGNK